MVRSTPNNSRCWEIWKPWAAVMPQGKDGKILQQFMVPSLQGSTPAEELQKVHLCQGWAVAQGGPGKTPADSSEVRRCISQADTRAMFLFSFAFGSCLTIRLLQSGSMEVIWHKKSGGRWALLPLACSGNWKSWHALSPLWPFGGCKLFPGPCMAPSMMIQGFSKLTGTAGIQRLMNKVGMAASQIKLKIAPSFLNCPCLLVLEQEKDLRQTH